MLILASSALGLNKCCIEIWEYLPLMGETYTHINVCKEKLNVPEGTHLGVHIYVHTSEVCMRLEFNHGYWSSWSQAFYFETGSQVSLNWLSSWYSWYARKTHHLPISASWVLGLQACVSTVPCFLWDAGGWNPLQLFMANTLLTEFSLQPYDVIFKKKWQQIYWSN